MDPETKTQETIFEELPRKWGLFLALGILMIVLGAAGLYLTALVTLASVLAFGALFIAGGILQAAQGFKSRETRWAGRLQHLLIAALYIAAGVLIALDPLAASLVISLMLAGAFIAMGATRIVYALKCRRQGWRWLAPVVAGLLDLLLGAIIILGWPLSALWVIGLLVSIEFIMNGWLIVATALAVRRLNRGQGHGVTQPA